MKKSIISLFIAFSLPFCTSVVHADEVPANLNVSENNQHPVTDFSGKPPFKRQSLSRYAEDLAQFEVVTTSQTCQDNKPALRGKPPFKRSTQCSETFDVAQFTVTNESPTIRFSGRPPFKRH